MTNQEYKKSDSKIKNMFAAICIAQTVCITAILITALIIKLFFKDGHIKLRKWCGNNIFEKTQVNDVFDEEIDP